jgi:hypothetical protein
MGRFQPTGRPLMGRMACLGRGQGPVAQTLSPTVDLGMGLAGPRRWLGRPGLKGGDN